jgi:hypothetical protein
MFEALTKSFRVCRIPLAKNCRLIASKFQEPELTVAHDLIPKALGCSHFCAGTGERTCLKKQDLFLSRLNKNVNPFLSQTCWPELSVWVRASPRIFQIYLRNSDLWSCFLPFILFHKYKVRKGRIKIVPVNIDVLGTSFREEYSEVKRQLA